MSVTRRSSQPPRIEPKTIQKKLPVQPRAHQCAEYRSCSGNIQKQNQKRFPSLHRNEVNTAACCYGRRLTIVRARIFSVTLLYTIYLTIKKAKYVNNEIMLHYSFSYRLLRQVLILFCLLNNAVIRLSKTTKERSYVCKILPTSPHSL